MLRFQSITYSCQAFFWLCLKLPSLPSRVNCQVETESSIHLLHNEINKAIAVALAPEIKDAIAKLIVVDWVNKEDVQREMRKRLRRLFLPQKIPRDQAEPIIIKLMDVARVNLR